MSRGPAADSDEGLKVGDEVSFQVLYQGRPVANQFINAGHVGLLNAYQLRTDKNGIAKFKICRCIARTISDGSSSRTFDAMSR